MDFMNRLVNMNRRLRIAIFYSAFLIFVIMGIIVDSLLVCGLGLVCLGVLIYTNIKYDGIYYKKLADSFIDSLEEHNFVYTDSYLTKDYLSGIAINTHDEKIAILNRTDRSEGFRLEIINFKDIIESTIVEDNVTITKTSKGGLIGGAAIGGMVAGGIGAVVGSMAGGKTSSDSVLSVTLSIVVNDLNNPIHDVNFLSITSPIKKDTAYYRQINTDITKWHKTISVILKRNELKTI